MKRFGAWLVIVALVAVVLPAEYGGVSAVAGQEVPNEGVLLGRAAVRTVQGQGSVVYGLATDFVYGSLGHASSWEAEAGASVRLHWSMVRLNSPGFNFPNGDSGSECNLAVAAPGATDPVGGAIRLLWDDDACPSNGTSWDVYCTDDGTATGAPVVGTLELYVLAGNDVAIGTDYEVNTRDDGFRGALRCNYPADHDVTVNAATGGVFAVVDGFEDIVVDWEPITEVTSGLSEVNWTVMDLTAGVARLDGFLSVAATASRQITVAVDNQFPAGERHVQVELEATRESDFTGLVEYRFGSGQAVTDPVLVDTTVYAEPRLAGMQGLTTTMFAGDLATANWNITNARGETINGITINGKYSRGTTGADASLTSNATGITGNLSLAGLGVGSYAASAKITGPTGTEGLLESRIVADTFLEVAGGPGAEGSSISISPAVAYAGETAAIVLSQRDEFNAPRTGNAANITLEYQGEGVQGTLSVTEVAPGVYSATYPVPDAAEQHITFYANSTTITGLPSHELVVLYLRVDPLIENQALIEALWEDYNATELDWNTRFTSYWDDQNASHAGALAALGLTEANLTTEISDTQIALEVLLNTLHEDEQALLQDFWANHNLTQAEWLSIFDAYWLDFNVTHGNLTAQVEAVNQTLQGKMDDVQAAIEAYTLGLHEDEIALVEAFWADQNLTHTEWLAVFASYWTDFNATHDAFSTELDSTNATLHTAILDARDHIEAHALTLSEEEHLLVQAFWADQNVTDAQWVATFTTYWADYNATSQDLSDQINDEVILEIQSAEAALEALLLDLDAGQTGFLQAFWQDHNITEDAWLAVFASYWLDFNATHEGLAAQVEGVNQTLQAKMDDVRAALEAYTLGLHEDEQALVQAFWTHHNLTHSQWLTTFASYWTDFNGTHLNLTLDLEGVNQTLQAEVVAARDHIEAHAANLSTEERFLVQAFWADQNVTEAEWTALFLAYWVDYNVTSQDLSDHVQGAEANIVAEIGDAQAALEAVLQSLNNDQIAHLDALWADYNLTEEDWLAVFASYWLDFNATHEGLAAQVEGVNQTLQGNITAARAYLANLINQTHSEGLNLTQAVWSDYNLTAAQWQALFAEYWNAFNTTHADLASQIEGVNQTLQGHVDAAVSALQARIDQRHQEQRAYLNDFQTNYNATEALQKERLEAYWANFNQTMQDFSGQLEGINQTLRAHITQQRLLLQDYMDGQYANRTQHINAYWNDVNITLDGLYGLVGAFWVDYNATIAAEAALIKDFWAAMNATLTDASSERQDLYQGHLDNLTVAHDALRGILQADHQEILDELMRLGNITDEDLLAYHEDLLAKILENRAAMHENATSLEALAMDEGQQTRGVVAQFWQAENDTWSAWYDYFFETGGGNHELANFIRDQHNQTRRNLTVLEEGFFNATVITMQTHSQYVISSVGQEVLLNRQAIEENQESGFLRLVWTSTLSQMLVWGFWLLVIATLGVLVGNRRTRKAIISLPPLAAALRSWQNFRRNAKPVKKDVAAHQRKIKRAAKMHRPKASRGSR